MPKEPTLPVLSANEMSASSVELIVIQETSVAKPTEPVQELTTELEKVSPEEPARASVQLEDLD